MLNNLRMIKNVVMYSVYNTSNKSTLLTPSLSNYTGSVVLIIDVSIHLSVSPHGLGFWTKRILDLRSVRYLHTLLSFPS